MQTTDQGRKATDPSFRGRGAASNPANRFTLRQSVPDPGATVPAVARPTHGYFGLSAGLDFERKMPVMRLRAIEELARAGIPVGVNVAPVVPGLTDHEIPAILKAAYDAGARHAGYAVVRLPHAVAPLFEEWLGRHFESRKEKVLNRIREMRGGQLYDSAYYSRMSGVGIFAAQIGALFKVHSEKYGFNQEHFELNAADFRRHGSHDFFPDLFETSIDKN